MPDVEQSQIPRPLARNRNYNVVLISQLFSEIGGQVSLFAIPLVVLALTGSAVTAGAAGTVNAMARLLVLIPAGALVDRWNRKRVLIACELVRIPALAALVLALWRGDEGLGPVFLVAAVDGAAAALFTPAEEALLPQLVHPSQLPEAVSRNAARSYLATLVGPGLGGLLLAAHEWLPFAVNAVTFAASFVLLLFLRLPAAVAAPARQGGSLAGDLKVGVRFIRERPVLRSALLVAVAVSIAFNALYLLVVTLAKRSGVPADEIGVIGAMTGVGGLLGAVVAPVLQRLIAPRVAISGLGLVGAAVTPLLALGTSAYLFGAVLAAIAFCAPTVHATVVVYQMRVTPDGLRGRVGAAMALTGGVAGVAGPLFGGVLADTAGRGTAVAVFVGLLLLAAVAAGLSRTLRAFPDVRSALPAAGSTPEPTRSAEPAENIGDPVP
ncbi:MFS transporter [Kitasatospora sp. NPDC096077]|uniref:MFS transporter n=1 Tax=Kitasatospora sp. NPDC096077 TaxID=3155544 RepID=UPI003324D8F0